MRPDLCGDLLNEMRPNNRPVRFVKERRNIPTPDGTRVRGFERVTCWQQGRPDLCFRPEISEPEDDLLAITAY